MPEDGDQIPRQPAYRPEFVHDEFPNQQLALRCNMQDMKPRHLFLPWLIGSLFVIANAQQEKSGFTDLIALQPELTKLQTQFEQMVPPGVTIEAKEVSRRGTSGNDLQVGYQIYVKGVPSDIVFRQIQWPVDRQKSFAGFVGITLNSEGLMMCAGRKSNQCRNGDRVDVPIIFLMANPLKGEPRLFVFIAPGLKIPISIVPDPVESEDRGCKLSVVRLSAKFELAMIEGSGFPPNSDVHMRTSNGTGPGATVTFDGKTTTSAQDTASNFILKADSKGILQTTTTLQNTTKTPKGVTKVEVTDPICSPKLTYEWGVF